MKRIFITGAMLALFFSNAKAQNTEQQSDSSSYKSRRLKIEEVNFALGYYTQEGNNSAVTGGVGDEHLTDVSTTIDIKLSKLTKRDNINSLDFELGVDSYSSASSDKIDPTTVSSASSSDMRIYPSLAYNFNNVDKHYNAGVGLSYSNEYDYTSVGVSTSFAKASKDNNRELSLKASVFFDTWKVILPVELRPEGYGSGAQDGGPVDSEPRTSYNFATEYSQVVNKNFQIALLLDVAYQEGLLGTSYQRVFFDDASAAIEKLPSSRFKLPLGLRANYFLGDNIVLRGYYRYYTDSWEVSGHTLSFEPTYKVSAFTSFGLLYRFYHQEAAEYFRPINQHSVTDEYYTSDYDLSTFDSHLMGINARFTDSNRGILGIKKINTLELRYGYYNRSNGLDSHMVTMLLKFK